MTKHYKQFLGKKIAVHMSSREEWDRVMATEIKDTPYWEKYTSESYIACDDGFIGDEDKMREYGYEIITTDEFFGEDEETRKEKNFLKVLGELSFSLKAEVAIQYFGLGSVEALNEIGMKEFIEFVNKLDENIKKEFLAKLIKDHKEIKNIIDKLPI